jgi:hypothetical protein
MAHGAGRKDVGPWEVDIDHTTVTCEDNESVHIVATLTGTWRSVSVLFLVTVTQDYIKSNEMVIWEWR